MATIASAMAWLGYRPITVALLSDAGVGGLVQAVVPESDFQQLRGELPESEEGRGTLFEVVDAGRWHEHE